MKDAVAGMAGRYFESAVRAVVGAVLGLRYRVKVCGAKDAGAKGKKGILFLANHPALIDPVILTCVLHRHFGARAIADKDQIDRPLIRWFAKRLRVMPIPDIAAYGSAAKQEIERVLDEAAGEIEAGGNVLLYPAGRVYRSNMEVIGANSSVERILKKVPRARIVLIRTSGLWGSGFSWANGKPGIGNVLVKGFFSLLASGVFFSPKREVAIEFCEGEDFPRGGGRQEINGYLERFYNEKQQHNIYVPYTIWQGRQARVMPEKKLGGQKSGEVEIPGQVREAVLEHIREMTGVSKAAEGDDLARDLGMDSLARTDLILWLEKEFGHPQANADAVMTVYDAMLAASGQFVFTGPVKLKAVPKKWYRAAGTARLGLDADIRTIGQAFLRQARREPGRVLLADQNAGVRTNREVVRACMAISPAIERVDGEYVGIMLPASTAASVLYLATVFAGKTAVMVNWTTGQRNIEESLKALGVTKIITSKVLVSRLESQGFELGYLKDKLVYAEEMAAGISIGQKIKALVLSYLSWAGLEKVREAKLAAVLFTSGSETVPKAVGLTHENVIANLRDMVGVVDLLESDVLMGLLPPFHSFGLTAGVLPALCGGLRTVYNANPMEAAKIGVMINEYRASILIGTPTFLAGILRASEAGQLASLRYVVTGAERCPEAVYEKMGQMCPGATILEGYGVTECSPVISLNRPSRQRIGTIGEVLPSLKYRLIEPETGQVVKTLGKGVLIVSGPSVFEGYINYAGPNPFIEMEGRRWYSTGDIVSVDDDGILTYIARVKRFVKLGGEMISLPAIEAVLEKRIAAGEEEGPVLAVEASGGDVPEIVLFTTRDVDRETVNGWIRAAGLSGLYSVRRVVRLESIPVLGTGKVNYREIKKRV